MLDLESGKIKDYIKFDVGNLAMCTGGHNNGRVGTIVHKEKHKGSFDIVHIKDAGEARGSALRESCGGPARCRGRQGCWALQLACCGGPRIAKPVRPPAAPLSGALPCPPP